MVPGPESNRNPIPLIINNLIQFDNCMNPHRYPGTQWGDETTNKTYSIRSKIFNYLLKSLNNIPIHIYASASISFNDFPSLVFHAVSPLDAPPLIAAAARLGLVNS